MAGFSEYDDYDGLGLGALVRSKEISGQELLEEAIARAEAVNPALNALVARCYEMASESIARGVGEGPFAGVPFLMKDLGPELAGVAMTSGSRYFADYIPNRDDEFVERAKRAGLVIFGKTNTPEFGLAPVTESRLFGPCRNPWDTQRTTGGSSGGSAAMVAAGVLPLAHGNDMGGSIRIPASCNGIFGMKSSRGRTPTIGGVVGEANVDLCVSRSVRDTAALLDAVHVERGALHYPPPHDGLYLNEVLLDPEPLRIAMVTDPMLGKEIDPQCVAACEHAARLCEQLGHHVEVANPIGVDYRDVARAIIAIFASNIGWRMHAANPTPNKTLRAGDLEPATWAMLVISELLSLDDLTTAVVRQQQLAQTFDAFFDRYDVVLMPTLASPPVPIGALELKKNEIAQIEVLARLRSASLMRRAADEIAKSLFDWIPYTPIFNLTGQPAMSVPLYWTPEGLPIGVHFAARLGRDAILFGLAGQLERAQPWATRRPPVHAGDASPRPRASGG